MDELCFRRLVYAFDSLVPMADGRYEKCSGEAERDAEDAVKGIPQSPGGAD